MKKNTHKPQRWRESADKYITMTPEKKQFLDDRHRTVLDVFSKHHIHRVLDIGCGDGNFSLLLGKACRAEEICGIDVSKNSVKLAKAKGVKSFVIDINEEDLPFGSNCFDGIFCGETIEHLFDPDHLLDEVYRVLKSSGIFVITTPNLASLHNRLALLFGFQPFPMNVSLKYNVGHIGEVELSLFSSYARADHIKLFTYRALMDLLRLHNFIIVETKGSGITLGNIKYSHVLKLMDRMLSVFPSLCYRIILCCEKGHAGIFR